MSLFEPKQLKLRDGRVVSLRSPVEDDAERLLAYVDAVRRETPFLLFSAEDALLTVQGERDWIQQHREGPGLLLVVEDDAGELIALSGIFMSSDEKARARHRGEVGISILSAWWGAGLGTALMQTLLGWAQAQSGLDVLWLGVYADNVRAVGLYEKLGFNRTGIKRWGVKRGDVYVDEIVMDCWVGEGDRPSHWTRAEGGC